MTRSTIKLQATPQDHKIAKLTAFAIGLHAFEAVIPSPLPGVKPGLANIITLIVLYEYGFASAAWVSLLRVFASSLLLGHFLSPTFALSLAGAVASLVMLHIAQHLPKRYFGAISLSILAAFAHVTGQLVLVRFWLIPNIGVSYLVPVFAMAALVFGCVNGFLVSQFLQSQAKHAQ